MRFENRYYSNKEMIKECVYKVFTRKMIIYELIILLISSISFLIFMNTDPIKANTSIIITIISFWMIILTPRLYLKELTNLDLKLHNGKRPEVIVTFGDKITIKEGEQKISIEYSKIKNYYRLKKSSILMFSEQNGIMFVEDKFTVGSREEFEKFILDKCDLLNKIIER